MLMYITRFNLALARLGIPPETLPSNQRVEFQSAGVKAGRTPHEAALVLLADLSDTIRAGATPAPIPRWVKRGKVDLADAAVETAIGDIGWDPEDFRSYAASEGTGQLNWRYKPQSQ
ncbi:hypothetical protein [Bosea sp. PAMC 26642]|uniref:hypothetical protein n=1 Tax=Bosea sp. (strain PAMC 26642) TaxID=1792307 RepID=UPI00076FF6C8|nr:hypothetical protein [Bosea sp. PAMC 26642]AMJ62786.1 hypothetical protein AXW83_23040 [Bosea sp. PAMC 26642]